MKKIKLLLAAIAAMVGLGANAQASFNHTYTVGVEPAAGGDYFLYNIGTGQFLTNGLNYGTRATVDNSGRVLTLNTATNGFSIRTDYVSFNNRKTRKDGYLTTNGYVDTGTNDADWVFTPVDLDGYTNAFTVSSGDNKYLFFDVNNTDPGCPVNVGANTGNSYSYWLLIPKTARETASDYSHYLINTQMNAPWEYKTWGGSEGWNDNAVIVPGGRVSNRCAEKFHAITDIYQEIKETLPAGRYKLYAQGFWRQDGSSAGPVLYIDDEKTTLAGFNANGEGTTANMDGASDAFSDGLYVNSVEKFFASEITNAKVGINITANDQWVIFDNFVLDYLGQLVMDFAVALPEGGAMEADKWYYFDVETAGGYLLSATELNNIVYTTDGYIKITDVPSTTISSSLTLSKTRYYVRSSSNQANFSYSIDSFDLTEEIAAYNTAVSNANTAKTNADAAAKLNADEYSALTTAISNYTGANAVNTEGTQNTAMKTALETATSALVSATTAVNNSISAYTSAKAYLDKMKGVLDNTNVYTTDAYNSYYGTWVTDYEAGTLDDATAAGLNANVAYSTGWHSSNNIDDILLSAWTIGGEQCANYDKSLYINTWSTEGANDGSDFLAPFFEYWGSDAASLGATDLVATVTGLKANTTYSFTVRARVRQTNDKTKIENGITMKVGAGESVDISAGNIFKTGPFYIGNFTAVGETDAEGKLTATITVAENSNISWLSFYNAKYTEGEDLSAYIADYEFALGIATESKDDAAYAAVTGKEKADLVSAITTYGDVNNEDKAALIEAKNALEAATTAFVGAASTYSAFAELNRNVATKLGVDLPTITDATTAADLDVNSYIVAEYTAAKGNYTIDAKSLLGDWTNAPGTNKSESWDGTTGDGSDTYYDEYNKSDRAMTQTITIPAGDYVMIAKGRASNNGRLTLSDGTETVTFPHKGSTGRGIATNGDATFDPEATYANSNNGRGWEYRVLTFTSDGSTPITLTFNWKTSGAQWVGLDDIELWRSATAVISEDADNEFLAGDYTTVTLNRTFSDENWNTFVVPFDIDNATLAAKFGTVAVAKYSESADGDNSTVTFTTMATPAITANVPVLLKTSTAPTSVTFNDVQIKANEAKVAGTGYFDFVGTYAGSTTIAAGDYFISANKLYKSKGETAIKGTRAYLQAKSGGAGVKAIKFSIDGQDYATAIADLDAAPAQNGAIYNIAGQRVSKAQKGIFIVNGKKVVK